MEKSTICLNMIVKNESDIIVDTLQNILDKVPIDYWVICDTGSTDNTVELITNFFKSKGIDGELIEEEWKDFGHNRTSALNHAYKKTDFVFIFDADDRIVGEIDFPKLEKGYAYIMHFGHMLQFKRMPLLCNHTKWYYEGVMHEIISTKEPYNIKTIEGNYHIATNVVISARNKKGDDKYYEDAIILEEAYKKNDNIQPRYGFYTAECFRFSGKENWNKAIEWYKITANEKRQWPQERYWSCYQLGNLYKELGEEEKSWYWYYRSYQYDSSRWECFFELIKKCREENNFTQGEIYFDMLKKCSKEDKNHKLFFMNFIHDHSLYSEMLVIYYYLNKIEKANEILLKIFMANFADDIYINMTNHNIKHFIEHINKDNWEFYGKFKRYCKKFNVPEELVKDIDKLFIE